MPVERTRRNHRKTARNATAPYPTGEAKATQPYHADNDEEATLEPLEQFTEWVAKMGPLASGMWDGANTADEFARACESIPRVIDMDDAELMCDLEHEIPTLLGSCLGVLNRTDTTFGQMFIRFVMCHLLAALRAAGLDMTDQEFVEKYTGIFDASRESMLKTHLGLRPCFKPLTSKLRAIFDGIIALHAQGDAAFAEEE